MREKNNSDITILSLLYGLVCFTALPPTQFYQEGTSPWEKNQAYQIIFMISDVSIDG